MNIEQRITDVLEQDGVRPQPIKDYIDEKNLLQMLNDILL
jgi:hypothetical protein